MAAVKALGTTLKVTISASPTTIPQITSLTPPQMSNPEVDTSALDSTWRTFLSTLPDGGTVDFTFNYDHANSTHDYLRDSFATGTQETWLVTFTDTGTATEAFTGHISAFNYGELTPEGLVQVSASIKVSGAVTITQ